MFVSSPQGIYIFSNIYSHYPLSYLPISACAVIGQFNVIGVLTMESHIICVIHWRK